MGIYDKKNPFDFFSLTKPALPYIAALVVLAGIILLIGILSESLKPQAIEASFSENPLDLTKGSSFTKLILTITNTTGKNAPATIVDVKPENSKDIIVSPGQTDLGLIENGNRRVTEFLVRPNPSQNVLAGTYTLNIYAVMNGRRFQKQVVLEIRTA